jgi:hypothetical protein
MGDLIQYPLKIDNFFSQFHIKITTNKIKVFLENSKNIAY